MSSLGHAESLTATTDANGDVTLTGVNATATGIFAQPNETTAIVARPWQTGTTTWKVRLFKRDTSTPGLIAMVSTQVTFLWAEVLP